MILSIIAIIVVCYLSRHFLYVVWFILSLPFKFVLGLIQFAFDVAAFFLLLGFCSLLATCCG